MNKEFTFDAFKPTAERSHDPLVRIQYMYEQDQKARAPFDKRIEAVLKDFFNVAAELKEVNTKLAGPTGLWESLCLQWKRDSLNKKFDILNDVLNTLHTARFIAMP